MGNPRAFTGQSGVSQDANASELNVKYKIFPTQYSSNGNSAFKISWTTFMGCFKVKHREPCRVSGPEFKLVDRTCEQKASKRPGTVKRPRCWRFSIGSAPLTSITKIDAQVRGGETRQDYKDTRRFPLEAPSCALLFRPCRLPDTCPPFSLREAWRFLIAHAVGISVRCRSFAPSWAVCTNPPFSPTAAPYPVTIVLSPTR